MTIAIQPIGAPWRQTNRPIVVSLVGLSGAGKSSLGRALTRLDAELRVRPRVPWWRYLASVPPLIPTFVNLHRPFRHVLGKEMKRFLRLHALHRLTQETRDCSILVFDEGPVYLLARMLVYGGENIQTRGFEQSWRHAIAMWASELHAIVWLQAPENVLAARLRTRRHHPFGTCDDKVVSTRFRAYNDAFTRVFDELAAAGGPRPWTVRTDRTSVDKTARELLARLRALRGAAYGTPA